MNDIANKIKVFSHSSRYWVLALLTPSVLLAVALFYQHVLDEQPCLLCIQVRLWLTLLILVALVGLFTRHYSLINSMAHGFVVLIALALVERSYQLLGTERGFIFGDCGFDLGLPAWFAIDEWVPSVYYVQTACGYTPEIAFGITMAEGLILYSMGLLLVSCCLFLASFLKFRE